MGGRLSNEGTVKQFAKRRFLKHRQNCAECLKFNPKVPGTSDNLCDEGSRLFQKRADKEKWKTL